MSDRINALRAAFPGLAIGGDDLRGFTCFDHVTRCHWYLSAYPADTRHGLIIHTLRLALLDDEASGLLTGSDVARCLGLP